ncbi:hypothetical protein [Roseateles amylovorans]|uniref:DUF4174 domain-containing protein n=1 Tax=Roseateles amylovorans TaxID=2978473 RepID=A0ABY6AYA0_9BURK|nr:hypothetical protein [Roseateles amylovorans]UXH76070.1 hypothetical protein N4261_13395 [Roseateles amylovorans]
MPLLPRRRLAGAGLALIAAAFLPTLAAAQPATVPVSKARALPTLALRPLPTGEPISSRELGQSTHTVLVLVDTNVAASQTLLQLLRASGSDGQGLNIVIVGPENAVNALQREHASRLPQAAWYTAPASVVASALHLPAMPALIGLDPGAGMAWQYVGNPPPLDKTRSMIGGWLARPVPPTSR